MFSFLKKKKAINPKKGLAFFHRENLIQTIDELNNTFANTKTINLHKSNSVINFQNIEFDSISENTLKDNFGDESYILHPKNGILGHKIYYYRLSAENFRFLIQIHFIDDKFFFLGNKIYTDLPITPEDKQQVIKQITDKYIPSVKLDSIEFGIQDPSGNIMYTVNNIHYYIKYIVNNETTRMLQKKYYNYIKPEAGKEIKEALNKMI